jgi:hypothetical protein
MVTISKKTSMLVFFLAGIIFIGIGIVAIIDSNIPRLVHVNELIKPNQSGIFTPDMNTGNTANIFFNGTKASVIIIDPNNKVILNQTRNNEIFNETIEADNNGKYKIQVQNTGNTDLNLNLVAYSKATPIAFSGQMMLIITGIIIIGLGIRAKNQI